MSTAAMLPRTVNRRTRNYLLVAFLCTFGVLHIYRSVTLRTGVEPPLLRRLYQIAREQNNARLFEESVEYLSWEV